MTRRLIIVTVIILVALCALTALGFHALSTWARGLEGLRKGEYADITVQMQTEIKAGLDAFLQKEEERAYTDYLYYHMPDNALTLQQQNQQASPVMVRSPLTGSLDQGLAYGHFQIEPDNRISTPNDDIQRREGPTFSNGIVATNLDMWKDNLRTHLLPKLKRPDDTKADLSPPDAPLPAPKAIIQNSQLAQQTKLAIDSFNRNKRVTQMYQQNRAVTINNFANNAAQVLDTEKAESGPLVRPMSLKRTQQAALPVSQDALVQVRIEPLVPILIPTLDDASSMFGKQVLMLRHVQVENQHYIQGFKLNEAELMNRIQAVANRFVALHQGLRIELSETTVPEACTSAILDFGFGSLVLNLIETDPTWLTRRVKGLRQWYLITLTVVVAAIGLGVISLWRGVRQQVLLSRQKDDFISAVSHELRTPLTAIRMYAEMLEKGWVKSQDKTKHYYTSVRQESERLSRLIENVLDFSRIQRHKKQVHLELGDLNACLHQVVDMMTPFAVQNGFTLKTEFADLDAQSFDKDAITQILVNLVDNAIKYARDAQDKIICVRTLAKDRHVILEVEDHGPGIPKTQQRKIFDPFYRTESESTRQTQGTGLGLALVKGFVEAHQGSIEILPAQPTGTIFRVTLELGVRG